MFMQSFAYLYSYSLDLFNLTALVGFCNMNAGTYIGAALQQQRKAMRGGAARLVALGVLPLQRRVRREA